MADQAPNVTIVGGGLVGALNACYLSKRGFNVEVHELRADIRKQEVVRGRSINLALSTRGLAALKAVGLDEEMKKSGIPMHSRMIHDLDGTRRPIPYGKKDQYIMSVDRRYLNELLLSAAERSPGVTMHFEHKLVSCDFEKGVSTFQEPSGSRVSAKSNLIIGCDGAYSSVRHQVMKATRLDFQQAYIPHGYIELRIPPTADNKFAMEINYLHIWPRNTFMMIALPNVQDKSFVLTLFMPFKNFEAITTREQVLEFFTNTFPDSIDLIGKEEIVKSFLSLKPLPLVTVKCQPYHVGDKCVLMGDAAHAMVPFYGQGMNCGFEDCLVFDQIMGQFNNDFAKVLPEYSEYRNPDAKAMCDLALYNYIEMRERVNSKFYLARKHFDNFLHWLMPSTWVPLYTSVSFSQMRYHKCIQNRAWQDKILTIILSVAGIAGGVIMAARGFHYVQPHFNTAWEQVSRTDWLSELISKWK